MIEQIINERGFYISDLNAIVIADLHIGYEKELERRGITVRKNTEKMVERIKKLMEKYSAEKLIILGDVKHDIGGFEEDISLLKEIGMKILIAKGNHDGNLEKYENFEIHSSRGFTLGNYGFFHGHSWPSREIMRKKYVFIGHIHPEIMLPDSLGNMHRYPCHLVGRLTERGREKYDGEPIIFVVAAFNPLLGSADVDIGPLLKNGIIGNFDVYLLNGAYLGKYDKLKH